VVDNEKAGPPVPAQETQSTFRNRLADVRHDLRTPVGHIIGYSEMLKEDLEDLAPELLPDIQRINAAGNRLAELIDDLLGAAKRNPDEIDFPAAHEQFRTQLNHVSGYCELVREAAEERNGNQLLPDLEKIQSAAQTFAATMGACLSADALAADSDAPPPRDEAERTNDAGAASSSAAEFEAARLGEGGDILVVDDDPANRELLERRLDRQGYDVVSVGDGEAALEHLSTNRVDLVLLDMVMPGLGGADVLRRLKDDEVMRTVPVIMLSALDDVNEVVNCVLLGAEDYVLKPFNPVLLKARIAATLEKHRLRAQHALHLRVFISSPGDVIPERQVVRRIIDRLNDELRGQAYLAPLFWEDEPLLASETFQSQIRSPRSSDIYIGIFWARMGSPLPDEIQRPDGTTYASGSEFEFEEAMSGYRAAGKPEIIMYRKTAEPLVPLTSRSEVEDRLTQKELLEGFLEHWFKSSGGESFTGAFHSFEDAEQLDELVGGHLRKLVMKRLEADDD
jgi:CheY-like chemotaxis protein